MKRSCLTCGIALTIWALALSGCALNPEDLIPPVPVTISLERPVITPPGDWSRAVWDPDSTALVATRSTAKDSQLWLIPLDGSPPTQLTAKPGTHMTGAGRVWARQGLLYSSNESGFEEIWLLGPKTFAPKRLGWAGGDSRAPSWAPDQRRFAFARRLVGADRWGLWVFTPSRLIELTLSIDSTGSVANPAWSPDGTKIMFQYGADGAYDLYYADVSGLATAAAEAAGASQPTTGAPAPSKPSTATVKPSKSSKATPKPGKPSTRAATPKSSKSSTRTPAPPVLPVSQVPVRVVPFIVCPGDKGDPSWVGTGKNVVFDFRATPADKQRLFTMWDGIVIDLSQNGNGYEAPAPSPDGGKLAFDRGLFGSRNILYTSLVPEPSAR